jgi:hypothetical protein
MRRIKIWQKMVFKQQKMITDNRRMRLEKMTMRITTSIWMTMKMGIDH